LRRIAGAGLPDALHGRVAHGLLRREPRDRARPAPGAARRDAALRDALPPQVPRAPEPLRTLPATRRRRRRRVDRAAALTALVDGQANRASRTSDAIAMSTPAISG